MSEIALAVVTAVNDDNVLAGNLAASPIFEDNSAPLIIKRGYSSAGQAYNIALDETKADVVIFSHQDVYLPKGWDKKLKSVIEALESRCSKWAILGVVGKDNRGNLVGGTGQPDYS